MAKRKVCCHNGHDTSQKGTRDERGYCLQCKNEAIELKRKTPTRKETSSRKNKICFHCQQEFPKHYFGRDKRRRDGLASHCRTCKQKLALKTKTKELTTREIRNRQRRAWYEMNKQRLKEQSRKRRAIPPKHRRKSSYLRRMRESRVESTLTLSEWEQILRDQKFCCLGCTRAFNKKLPATKDHIIPVSKGGGLTKENIQALCRSCNSKKSDKIIKVTYGYFVPKATLSGD